MKAPTENEIEAAGAAYSSSWPEPVAASINGTELEISLRLMATDFQKTDKSVEQLAHFLKSGVVLGLNYGIRIGESRRYQ